MPKSSGENSISDNTFSFNAFGISVEIQTDRFAQTESLKKSIDELFRNNFSDVPGKGPTFKFEIKNSGPDRIDLYKNSELLVSGKPNPGFFNYVETQIRLSVAEFAVDRVFVHAGVVSWDGKGIVIPGNSFTGKTSLVREFIAAGAEYLSDEYAVFDPEGLVHPFAKPLSLREKSGGVEQTDHKVEDLGGICADGPVSVAYVLHTSYEPEAIWEPNIISRGVGILKLLEHTLPIRVATQFSLEVFNRLANDTVFLQSPRGEAPETAQKFLKFIQ